VNAAKIRLIATAALFVGWLAWLGYTALAKNRGPVVSHVQAAAAAHVVVGEVKRGADDKPDPEVIVVESLKAGSRENPLPRAIPIDGKELPMHSLVGMQRSPGYELSGTGSPTIYRMSNEVRAQAKKLFP
jgi:hypothetical protein